MRIIYTKHALEKFTLLSKRGWTLSKTQVNQVVLNPKWTGKTKLGQSSAMSLLDKNYILRVIYNQVGNSIKIITFHPARKGRYETQVQQN